jgi:hypothetical protein
MPNSTAAEPLVERSRRCRKAGRDRFRGHLGGLASAPDPDPARTGAVGDDDLALEHRAADGVDGNDLGDAIALAGDVEGIGIHHGDIGNRRIADDHGTRRAAELNALGLVDLDVQAAGLGRARNRREQDGSRGQGGDQAGRENGSGHGVGFH